MLANDAIMWLCASCCCCVWLVCSYLHSCDPPVIHGNLTTDTIFIQHNGLIKIGSGNLNMQIYQITTFIYYLFMFWKPLSFFCLPQGTLQTLVILKKERPLVKQINK